MADYKFSSPVKEEAPAQSPTGSEKEAARIWNVFTPTIILDELSLPQAPKGEERKTERIEDMPSAQYPLIKINSYYLGEDEINSMKIDSTGKLPKITLTATFGQEAFLAREMPKDGDIISIAIQSGSDVLKPIRNDYVITNVIPVAKGSNRSSNIVMTFFGELFVPGYRSYLGNASIKGTSMEALKVAAQELGLGFNTNEEDTDDTQIWLSTSQIEDFFYEVCERSWKDENSFFDWWIDVYYNLNFVNVQKQLLSSETEIDNAALIDHVQRKFFWGSKRDKTTGAPKVFSNYEGYKNTSFYIETWRPLNNSTKITFEYGTSIDCTFYEHNARLYEDPESKKYWNLDIPPDYDPEKLDTHILLRGRATWDPSTGSDEPARANYNYSELYKKSPWLGIQYTLTNPDDDPNQWDGNQHSNYMRARVHNTINMVELDKLNVEINVGGVNLNIIKGDKIPVSIVRKDRIQNRMIDRDFTTSEVLDLFYSGWYYVKGFSISWVYGNDGIVDSFSQSFVLTRREWPTPLPSTARPKETEE